MPQLSLHSPIGDVTVTEEDGAIVSVDWGWSPMQKETPLLIKARDLLNRYFDGEDVDFDLPLAPSGSPFLKKVWREISRIPYGGVATYGMIAHALQSGPRAVGGACGRNHIPIIIPCHRVLGANRAIGGYSGNEGLTTKRFLLRLEGVEGF
jgi:methylated-DNA-[protein]-cysteine S-methyltransferase